MSNVPGMRHSTAWVSSHPLPQGRHSHESKECAFRLGTEGFVKSGTISNPSATHLPLQSFIRKKPFILNGEWKASKTQVHLPGQ
jgi:hypothetical protein